MTVTVPFCVLATLLKHSSQKIGQTHKFSNVFKHSFFVPRREEHRQIDRYCLISPEEVLGSGSAVWLSPEGNRLAFARFDDTEVDNYTYFEYGEPGTLDSQYPEVITLKYPKVIRATALRASGSMLDGFWAVRGRARPLIQRDLNGSRPKQKLSWCAKGNCTCCPKRFIGFDIANGGCGRTEIEYVRFYAL